MRRMDSTFQSYWKQFKKKNRQHESKTKHMQILTKLTGTPYWFCFMCVDSLFHCRDWNSTASASWRDQNIWGDISWHCAACGDYKNLPALEVKSPGTTIALLSVMYCICSTESKRLSHLFKYICSLCRVVFCVQCLLGDAVTIDFI